MELYDYALAGYNGAKSMEPAYASSPNHMAYVAGVWCRQHALTPYEIKTGRGYSMIVNRHYLLRFGHNDSIVSVTSK